MIMIEWVHRWGLTAEKMTSKKAKTELRQWKEMLVHCKLTVAKAFLCGGVERSDQYTAVTMKGNVVTVL